VSNVPLTSSLGEFPGYWDWLWYPGLPPMLDCKGSKNLDQNICSGRSFNLRSWHSSSHEHYH